MKNFQKWLFIVVLFLSIWWSAVSKKINHKVFEEYPKIVLFFPAIALVLFGMYAMTVVLYKVFSFNDCEEATLELKEHIKAAKADLKKKGFQFDEEDMDEKIISQ